MNSKQLTGLAIVGIADGTIIGRVSQTLFDPEAKRVVGFATTGDVPADGRMIDVAEVHSVGPDALMVDAAAAVRGAKTGAAAGGLVPLDDLVKRKVVTEGGTFVGEVASLEFDERRFDLTEVEVSTGFFKTNTRVPATQLVSVGDDILVVADAVCADAEPEPATAEPTAERFVVGDVAPTATATASN